jgi:hypothetical protein
MRLVLTTALVLTLTFLSGCSTTQEVVLAKANPSKKVTTIAQVLEADNSTQMNSNLEVALQKEGLSLKAPLAAGTRKSPDVDAIISYVDVWRWDLAMYLKSFTVRLYDAETGDLLATGEWNDSPLHAFRDAKLAMQGVVSDMFAKLRVATKDK